MLRIFIFSILCLLVVGCKSTPSVYVPKALLNTAESNTTILKTDSEHEHGIFIAFDERLYISSINEESTFEFFTISLSEYPEVAKIPLGENVIGLKYRQGQISADGCVAFNAKEGISYMATKKNEGFKVVFWVVEEGTNKVVSKPCPILES